jgi:hypothetical protein
MNDIHLKIALPRGVLVRQPILNKLFNIKMCELADFLIMHVHPRRLLSEPKFIAGTSGDKADNTRQEAA